MEPIRAGGVSAVRPAVTRRHRVLVALPGSHDAAVVAEALAAEGVDVVACDGAGPAECYRARAPHLAVLEASAEGVEACREIRALGGDAEDVPILLVGSEPPEGHPSRGIASGVGPSAEGRATESKSGPSEWLSSPFSVEYARSRIRAWLLRVECRWVPAPLPEGEEERLDALRLLELLDSEPEERFDRLARLAAGLLEAPMSLVTLVDRDRQWFKSKVGLQLDETSRDASFCAHTILAKEPMVVSDALHDERFADSPLVAGPPHVRFYAGCPLTLPDGHALGTLCVFDTRPRHLTPEQRSLLRDLADLVEEELARR